MALNEKNASTQGGHGAPQAVSDAVLRADALDAAGNHAEAVNELAAAARRRDVDALTRLGRRLLVGDRAPALPRDGIGLLEQADELGGAQAAETLSVLYAVGLRKGFGLREARDKLVAAAERGSASALAQLEVLAAESGEAGNRSARDSAHRVRDLARCIDVAAWQRAYPSTDLSTSPLVRAIPSFIGEACCRWLVGRARGRLTRALVYDALSQRTVATHTRTNTAAILGVLDTDLVCVLVQARMAACVGVPFRQLEPISVLHYAEGEEITEHYDFVDPNMPSYEQELAVKGQRIVTFLIYLNDDYAGGETEFPKLALRYKGKRGDALYLVNALPDGSADVRTLHAGRPPTRNEKWIVAQFMRNRPTF